MNVRNLDTTNPADPWPVYKTFERIHLGGEQRTRVTVGLHYIRGNSDAYWSVTCETDERINGRWRESSGGADHTLIARLFPRLVPHIALHLSNSRGVPMHCLENGWYHLGMTKWEPYNERAVMEHYRIDASTARWLEMQARKRGKGWLHNWCARQAVRWEAESDTALVALLG